MGSTTVRDDADGDAQSEDVQDARPVENIHIVVHGAGSALEAGPPAGASALRLLSTLGPARIRAAISMLVRRISSMVMSLLSFAVGRRAVWGTPAAPSRAGLGLESV